MIGNQDVADFLLKYYHFKTLKENQVGKQSIYVYTNPDRDPITGELKNSEGAGTYLNKESDVEALIRKHYMRLLNKMLGKVDDALKSSNYTEKVKTYKLREKLSAKLIVNGISKNEVENVMGIIRGATFVERTSMNPDGFIAFRNGLLNNKTWKLEGFDPKQFITYKINGNYDTNSVAGTVDEDIISNLDSTPMFKEFLLSTFPEESIPMVIDYMSYCLYPGFPKQKVLVIAGPPRQGKGTLVQLLEYIVGEGANKISMMKLLISENRFSYQGIEGKNVLIDSEIKREYNRRIDFSVLNSLFGGDTLPLEKKFKDEFPYRSRAKGILVASLPIFSIDNTAFLSRLFIVLTRPSLEREKIPDLSKLIWEKESNQIVTLIANRLKLLIEQKFTFSGEKSVEDYISMWEMMTDSVQTFIEAELTAVEDAPIGYVKPGTKRYVAV
ncbi:MAG: hypothetical protein QXU18_15460, partial [Thermoplasmatales archaeon]